MSKNKNVPELRFKEFIDEWNGAYLGEVVEKVGSGSTPLGGSTAYKDEGIVFIRSQNVNENRLILKDVVFISDSTNQKMKGSIVKANDILLNITGASLGRSCVVPQNFEIGNVNQHVCIIRLNESYNSLFLQSRLSSEYGQKLMSEGQTGSGREGLNFQSIRKFYFNFPSLPEQAKIASFLTSVDDKLQTLKKKKALLEQYKKGVMQKIFSQELRFKDDKGNDFPEWEATYLGNLCEIKTGKLDANAMVPNGPYRFYTCAKNYYFIDKFAFDTEALLVSGNGANVGYIHYYKGKFNAYQRTYVLDGFEQNIIFIKYYLEKFLSERIDLEKKEGNTPYIVLSTLSEMNISLPSLHEQIKIASFLTCVDDKINQTQFQIEKTESWKKGLLQKMFI